MGAQPWLPAQRERSGDRPGGSGCDLGVTGYSPSSLATFRTRGRSLGTMACLGLLGETGIAYGIVPSEYRPAVGLTVPSGVAPYWCCLVLARRKDSANRYPVPPPK